MTDTQFEQTIIQRCQQGDREAFHWLVQQYGDLAMRLAYIRTRDREQAEDIIQDAFIAAWRAMPLFQAGRPFRPWLLRIVLNQCNMSLRRKTLSTVPLEQTTLYAQNSDPEQRAAHDEARLHLRTALATLPDEQRQVVDLRYFADLSVPEIAQIIDCPLGTVKSRIHRGLASLRAAWRHTEPALFTDE